MRVIMVTVMYPSAERPHWGTFVRSQVESLKALGVECLVYEIQGWRNALNYARAIAEIPLKVRDFAPDIIHAHYGLSAAAAIAARGVPLVVSFCGDDLLGRPQANGTISRKSKWLVSLCRTASRRAEAVIVKSHAMRKLIPEHQVVDVIPNGVDLSLFEPKNREQARAALGWRQTGEVLLFPANPNETRKNITLARQVEEQLKNSGRDVRLEIVYAVPQQQISLSMNAADVLLLPSLHEGSPNTVKEAMAVNLPVVSAEVGDCAERLAGCTPGAVVARDVASFTNATLAVLKSGIRSNGRQLIAPLALDAVGRQVFGIYQRVLARRNVDQPIAQSHQRKVG